MLRSLNFLKDQEEEENSDKISSNEIEEAVPVGKDTLTFDALIRNKTEMEYFQSFLEEKHQLGNFHQRIEYLLG